MAELRSVVKKLLEVVKAIHANSPTAAGRQPLNDAERELAEMEPPPVDEGKAKDKPEAKPEAKPETPKADDAETQPPPKRRA